MRTVVVLALLSALTFFSACKKSAEVKSTAQPAETTGGGLKTTAAPTFAYGADISWITEQEASGKKFYNSSGTQQDIFTVIKSKGINAVRFRVWVNPSNTYNSTADVIAKCKRAKAAGLSIMIDFHYSDTWADPGNQTKPSSWASQDFTTLMSTVYNYTYNTLNTIKSNGITPDYVQVGNETSDGMLWPDGRASLSATNFKNFAWLINCGYDATKAIFPSAKVIVHVANGFNNTTTRWIFDGIKANGGKWDICGFSVYPSTSGWQTTNNQVLANMKDMVSRYGKQVMICEAGMDVSAASTCKSFLTDLIAKTKSVSGGLGVYYWEPQAYASWKGYNMGAFDSSGKPTVAMDAFIH
ncbi:glycoside hydrolase family 53 protein [Mucilaginibacter defluvii]|uniref:Arabinogalactan endo-beta-1,4-galactanase n=1 Tax=Mucilaginibacter defluvii TaxID=1196019 RepID=A0ABP9FLU4_9SPHI